MMDLIRLIPFYSISFGFFYYTVTQVLNKIKKKKIPSIFVGPGRQFSK